MTRVMWRMLVGTGRVLFLLVAILGAVVGAGYIWLKDNVLDRLPSDLSSFREYRPPSSCRVFAADGTEIDQFYLERRIWTPLADLPPTVSQAFISAEDRRFLQHPGVDTLGILRAMVENIQAGTIAQGGSTLTQQLVKNLLVGKERSYRRKLEEAILAWRLEKELSKEDILELYLNYVYLGSGNYGVEAAARDYFGVSARQLNVGQAALLAGLVPAPSRYSPRVNPKLAASRRELVLRAMARDGYIPLDQIAGWTDDPVVQPRESRPEREVSTAYATHVRREIRRLVGSERALREGLQIHTALDLQVQRVAQRAVRRALEEHEKRQGRAGPIRRIPHKDWSDFLARASGMEHGRDGQVIRPDAGECFQALIGEDRSLDALRAGPWSFRLAEEERAVVVRAADGRKAGPLKDRVRPGDVLRVCLRSEDVVALEARPWADGAAVVIENATGRVAALVGGYSVGLEGFVRATQARRQPGSSFKPYVYAAHLAKGGTQLDLVLDAPIALPAGGGKIWSPKNYTGRFAGPLPMRTAMAQSLNTVAVRLALEVGPDEVVRTAEAMGVRTPLRKDVTVALGSAEVTPLDQALGFATLARMGRSVEPAFIDSVLDADGMPLNAEELGRLPGGAGEQVLPPAVAYQLVDILREVVESGTARKVFKPGFDRAGKTGTTNGYVDAWFVGITPRYTVAVWIGTDGKLSLGEDETGGRAALPAWQEIVEALPSVEGERFPVPDEVMLVPWNGKWVGISRASAPSSVLEAADPGEAPLPAFN